MLRVWQLPHFPPGLWYDEAYYSMDAAWLLDGGPWQLFFAGNNGREPIFIYLQALFIWLFGAIPLTSRLIGPLAGTLTVPLLYILTRRLARHVQSGFSQGLPYLATAGLAVSYWHLGLSRSGFRAILLPLVAIIVFYAFWRGWQERKYLWFGLAGVALGLSQYTYLAARILPLLLGVYALSWTALNRRTKNSPAEYYRLSTLWLGLMLTGLTAGVVFAPLGWLFWQNPALFSARTGDVIFTPDSPAELFEQLLAAGRLFVDGGDLNWRHNLPGRPMLGWLGWLGFWPGLILCLRRFRQPAYLFLAVALLILYLPAFVATPPIHALRLATLLPIYFILFALGLLWLVQARRQSPRRVVLAVAVVLSLETGLTFFDYFYRWGPAEESYIEYNGPLVDFIQHAIAQTQTSPVVIPFQLYVHPTSRYLLHARFSEQIAPASLRGPVQWITLPDDFRMLNVANIPGTPAWVWLERDAQGRGRIYVSRPARQVEQDYLNKFLNQATTDVFRDRWGRELAQIHVLPDPVPLASMFNQTQPERTISITWANLVALQGYEVIPPVVQPGQPITLNFYWRSLSETTFDKRLFLQLLNAAGQPINQWEGDAFREDMYRWRPGGILPSQHTLWLGQDTPPGSYLVRLGFFDKVTGQRLPISLGPNEVPVEGQAVDQTQLGLFYVAPAGSDPYQPATPLAATFDNAIKLTGVTMPQTIPAQLPNPLPVTFHWQALQPTPKAYTVFLQLLDEAGQVTASWDSQPFNGLYPTTRWSPGELIADTFHLPLPAAALPPGHYRLICGFYEVVSGQRLPVNSGGDFASLIEFEVE